MKQKNQNQKKPKTKALTSRKTVKVLSHPIAKKLRLIRHAHSGKLVRSRHSSYAILMIFLAITGFFIFVSYNITSAETKSAGVSVNAIVPGPPPSTGAVITTLKNGAIFKSAIVDVAGTCAYNTEVVVYSNSTLVGSALCTASLTFQIQIQLFNGANSLTALNYDTLNQAGPVTTTVNVTYDNPAGQTSSETTPLSMYPIVVPGVTPKAPESCSTGSSAVACNLQYVDASTCDGYAFSGDLPKSPDVRVAIVCLPRYIGMLDIVAVGVVVWGGQTPYAISVQWGGTTVATDTVRSVSEPGYYTMTTKYSESGYHTIKVRVSDGNGVQAYAQAGIQVPDNKGLPVAQTSQNFGQYFVNSLSVSWFDTPVPTYLLAVAVVLGFWAGDYFERSITVISNRVVHKKRRRHA